MIGAGSEVGTICHVTDSGDPGGAESIILMLVSALDRAGVPQHVVTMNQGWLYDQLMRRGWPVTLIPSRGSFDVRWVVAFRKFLRDQPIELVHTHLLDAGFYGALGAKAAGVPCIATEHGDVAMGAKSGSSHWVKLATTQWIARRVVAVSDKTAKSLERRLGFGAGKIRVVTNGIDATKFAAMPAPADARQALAIPASARVIGSLGALTDVKDHGTLLRAHAQLPQDVWCVIAGEGPLRESLSRLARDLGTSERVVFPGFVDNPRDVLAGLDVFCLSSRSEGLPLALLEAIAAQRVTVCTSVGGIPELLERAGGGRVVAPGDARVLAAALEEALEGRVARAQLPDEFTVGRMARDYLSLYREVTGRSRRLPGARARGQDTSVQNSRERR